MWGSSVFDFLFSLPKVHGRYLHPPIQLAPDPSAVLCLGTLRADTLWHHSLDRQNKLDIVKAMMDCLLAKAIPCVTECVVAELEKLGPKYRVALRLSKDPRFQRLPCSHQGTYADDCLVQVSFILCIFFFQPCCRRFHEPIHFVPWRGGCSAATGNVGCSSYASVRAIPEARNRADSGAVSRERESSAWFAVFV